MKYLKCFESFEKEWSELSDKEKQEIAGILDLTIALFFDGVCIGALNKGTECSAAKPADVSLAWTRGNTMSQELGPWQMLPWRYGAKPLG